MQQPKLTSERDVPIPSIDEDYPGWVSAMRGRWRKQRAERRAIERPRTTLGGLLEERSSAMASATWDIVQLAPTIRPGEFRMWVLVDRQMHALRLQVPRQVYVNFLQPPQPGMLRASYQAEVVHRTLPRGAKVHHLMRFTIPESEYVAREAHSVSYTHLTLPTTPYV